ncbi:MAG: response regulator [Candidatus Marinimicrobia bacterium]|nr:response regulator [Candidatus Neomarinimicrobiota bacterium]
MNILVIDDDIQVNKLISSILTSEGHQVTEAFDGDEGLNFLKKDPNYDLVITDIIMPEKEGIEIIREIKKNYPRIKIIAISGGGRIDANNYLTLAKSLGADEIMEKPFSKSDLSFLIKNLFQ